MARFTGIPPLPMGSKVDPALATTINAVKQNLELLMGTRGESGAESRALFRGQIRVSPAPELKFRTVSGNARGYSVGGTILVALDDYVKLANDVQTLANDVAALHRTVNTLIEQLRA